jgi:hypothetical protein
MMVQFVTGNATALLQAKISIDLGHVVHGLPHLMSFRHQQIYE